MTRRLLMSKRYPTESERGDLEKDAKKRFRYDCETEQYEAALEYVLKPAESYQKIVMERGTRSNFEWGHAFAVKEAVRIVKRRMRDKKMIRMLMGG
jgi:hypothetical protein